MISCSTGNWAKCSPVAQLAFRLLPPLLLTSLGKSKPKAFNAIALLYVSVSHSHMKNCWVAVPFIYVLPLYSVPGTEVRYLVVRRTIHGHHII